MDQAPPGGTCAYRTRFAGDRLYAPADRWTTADVAFPSPDLSVTVVGGTGTTEKTETGRLGTTHINRMLTITAQPSGGTEVVLASAVAVDSTGTSRPPLHEDDDAPRDFLGRRPIRAATAQTVQ